MDDLSAVGIEYEVKKNVDKNAVVLTDVIARWKLVSKKHQVYVCKDNTEVSKVFPLGCISLSVMLKGCC